MEVKECPLHKKSYDEGCGVCGFFYGLEEGKQDFPNWNLYSRNLTLDEIDFSKYYRENYELGYIVGVKNLESIEEAKRFIRS